MKIAEIDHIHLYVENIEQAEKWYNEILGFERTLPCTSGLNRVGRWS